MEEHERTWRRSGAGSITSHDGGRAGRGAVAATIGAV